MNEQQHILQFIKNVTGNDFKRANDALAAVVNEKIKRRIHAADHKLSTSGKK